MSGTNRQSGKVKFFDKKKGFGFITADDGKELFCHISDVEGEAILSDNNPVTFTVEQGKKGPKAANVRRT